MKILNNISEKRFWAASLWPLVALMCLLAFVAPSAYAQNAKLDLSHLDKLAKKASEVTNVNLGDPMLKLAADTIGATKQGEKGAAIQGVVRNLKGIYVKSFEFSKLGQYNRSDIESVLKQLQTGSWKPVINVKEEKSGETTDIYVMEEGGGIVGMAIVAAEPKELTIVNLVGPIDLSQLGALGSLGSLFDRGGKRGNAGDSKPQLQHRDQPDQNSNPPQDPK
jgi:hypothetical protein